MNAKVSIFSELSNILSVKKSLRTNLMALFTRFGLRQKDHQRHHPPPKTEGKRREK